MIDSEGGLHVANGGGGDWLNDWGGCDPVFAVEGEDVAGVLADEVEADFVELINDDGGGGGVCLTVAAIAAVYTIAAGESLDALESLWAFDSLFTLWALFALEAGGSLNALRALDTLFALDALRADLTLGSFGTYGGDVGGVSVCVESVEGFFKIAGGDEYAEGASGALN